MSDTLPQPRAIPARRLSVDVWSRLRPWRRQLGLSLGLLVFSVPFMNFHPLVWGIVADHLIEGTLSAKALGMWLAIMLVTYLIGLGANA